MRIILYIQLAVSSKSLNCKFDPINPHQFDVINEMLMAN